MAEANKASSSQSQQGFVFSPHVITAPDYQKIVTDRQQFKQLRDQASNEFMYQYYKKLLKIANEAFERAQKANARLENKEDRAQEKARRERLKVSRNA